MGVFCTNVVYDSILLLTSILLATVFYVKHKYRFWANRGITQMEPQFPFGNMKDFILKRRHAGLCLLDIYNYLKKQNVPFGGYYQGLTPYFMPLDLDLIKQMLIKDFPHFTDKEFYCDEKTEPLTGHLIALSGARWKHLRASLTPTFTSSKMKMMFQTLVAASDELQNVLDESARKTEPLDIKDILSRFGTDVIGSCAFGIECNSLKTPNNDFRKYSEMLLKPQGMDLVRAIFASIFPSVTKFFGVRLLNRDVSNFFMNMVKETVRYREKNNIFRKDFLQILLELKNKGKVTDDDVTKDVKETDVPNTLTVEQIAAQCLVFFMAGFETSSTAMTWCLYELTQNPDIQEKLRREVINALKEHNGEITYEAIMSMEYLDQVINETLRKHPPINSVVRKCTLDYKIPNTKHIFKKGQMFRVSLLGIHHDPVYYPAPEKFLPERFTEEEKSKRPLCAFLPFGEGPRQCIGLRFGLMQTKVGLTVLLKDYRFTLNEKTKLPIEVDPKSYFIMTAKNRIWLDAQKVAS